MSGVSYKLHQSETGDGFTRAGSLGDDIPRDWKQTLFGIGPESIQSGKPKSRLIYPLSIFGIGWIAVTALLLLYTAIATPPMIALHWLDLECTVIPTLYFDVVVDCFFLVDIVLNFFTGIFHSDDYIDDPKKVARFYLKGMFWFDCITSFPISFVELAIKAAWYKSMSINPRDPHYVATSSTDSYSVLQPEADKLKLQQLKQTPKLIDDATLLDRMMFFIYLR